MLKSINENYIYPELIKLLKNNQLCVLSTVTKTTGSTPQKSGSSAIFSQTELLAGTIGGGVTELRVNKIAREILKSKESGYYSFDLGHDISDDSEAICGGGMDILLDTCPEKHIDVFEDLHNSYINRIHGVLVTFFSRRATSVSSIKRRWITTLNIDKYAKELTSQAKQKLVMMLDNPVRDEFFILNTPHEKGEESIVSFETILPPERLIIAGAGHVGKALSHLANLLDFEVTVWDDRKEYANEDNFPDAHAVFCGEQSKALGGIQADRSTFIVIVTRGHKHDADVLRAFIKLPVAYIGMIGSRKKIAEVHKMFIRNKWATQEQWNKIYSPIGIDIHSKTVQEIALSIAAQLVQVRNQNVRKNG